MMGFPPRRVPRPPRSVRFVNRAVPLLEPLEVRALLAGQPTTLSAISGSGIRTGTATISAQLTSQDSALVGQTVGFSLDENGTFTAVGTAVTDANGVATLTSVSLTGFNVGLFMGFVGVSYAGNATYTASSGSGTLTVTPQAVARVALGSSANPSLPGELMTFGVMVIPLSGGPTPTGTIQYQVDGTKFGPPVTLAGGSTTSGTDTSLAVGTHTITAIYSGDATYPAQTATMTQTVESPSAVTGHVYTVTSLSDTGTGPGTSGDLRYAIAQANANPGSVIDFSVTGTIQLTKALPNVTANTTINGPGPSLLTLKGQGASSMFSDLVVPSGVTATISGLTITNGDSSYGGGVSDGGTLTLTDCTISGNTALLGGGGITIDPHSGTLTLSDCAVSDNTLGSSGVGGGVSDGAGSSVAVTDCIISGNSSGEGGGIDVWAGAALTAEDSLISGNSSHDGGGGISSGGSVGLTNCSLSGNTGGSGGAIYGAPTLLNCTLSGNSSMNPGGALHTSTATLTDCTFIGNSCAKYEGGGAIATNGTASLNLTGCAFMSNSAWTGGALWINERTSLTDCTITGNTASSDGGGIFSRAGLSSADGYHFSVIPGVLTFDGCVLSGNSAKNFGGGLFNIGGMALSESTISGNTAGNGGGIADMSQYISNTHYPYPVVSELGACTIGGNSATSYGGGMLNQGSLTLTNCTVTGNIAQQGGGLANPIRSQARLYTYESGEKLPAHPIAYSAATITGCSISSNSALTYGGGIENQGALTLTSCTVSGNTAKQDGGGLANLSLSFFYPQGSALSNAPATASLSDSTIYGNMSLYGGGIATEEADLTLTNDTLAANRTAGSGNYATGLGTITSIGDILLNNTLVAGNNKGASPSTAPGDVAGTIDSKSAYNLIGDGDLLKGISNGSQGNKIGSLKAGTIIDPKLGPLANNGGPTETVALQSGSPAVDAGSNGLAVDPATQQPLRSDQRGAGYARIVNGTVDIGAFEYGAFYVTPTQLVASPPPPNSIADTSTLNLTVSAEDNSGNTGLAFDSPVTVSIASGPAGGALGGTLIETADLGVATFSGLSFSEPGSYTLTASGGKLSGTIGPIQVMRGPAVQVSITTEPPADVSPGAPFQLIVAAEDSLGFVNPSYAGSATVALISNPGGATLGGTLTAQFQSGVATFSDLTLNAAADGYLLQVTSGTLVPATTSAVDVAPVQLAIATQPPAKVAAGTPFGLVVDADSSGQVDSSFNGTVTVSLANAPAGAALGGALSVTATGGVATFSGLTLDTAASGYILSISNSGHSSITSNAITVTPAAASQWVIHTQPSSTATAGLAFASQPVVYEEDQFGNIETVDSSTTVTAGLSYGAGPLQGTTQMRVSKGVATLTDLADDKSETIALRFTGGSLTAATSEPINIAAAPASHFAVSSPPPSRVAAGATFGFVVEAEDPFGNVDTSFGGPVTAGLARGASGSLGGVLTVRASGGAATFSSLSINKAGGGYTLTLASQGLTTTATDAFAVVPGAATQLAVLTQPQTIISAGSGFRLVVAAEDDYGNVNPDFGGSVTVSLAANPGQAALGGASTVAAVDGVANFNLSLSNAGEGYALLASSPGLARAVTQSIDVTPARATPLTIDGEQVLTSGRGRHRRPIGLELVFNGPLRSSGPLNLGDFTVSQLVKRRRNTISQPVVLRASFMSSPNTVTLMFSGKPQFSQGGQIVVTSTPAAPLAGPGGDPLSGRTIFTILPKARGVE